MNYCQKHKNHHCVHSHNCKDPSHKKNRRRASSSSHQDKSSSNNIAQKYHPPMGIINDNEQYHFLSSDQPSKLQTQGFLKQISTLSEELQTTKKNFLTCDIENRKLSQKNFHLECQIQYLRQQLDLLVTNHSTDIHKQIKKSLIQHTNLNIRIKQLTNALFDKEKLAQELSSQNYSLSRKNRQLQTSIKGFQQKNKIIILKNQQLSFEASSQKNRIKVLQGQLRLLKERYSTLATSADRSVKQRQNKLSEFQSQKEKLVRNHKNKDSELKRIKELHQVEKKAWEKMINQLRENALKKDQQSKKSRHAARQAEQGMSQLKQDIEHAKKIILKYQKVNEECAKVRLQTKQIQALNEDELDGEEKKTVAKIKISPEEDDQKIKLLRLQQLQKQNIQLRNQIQNLEANQKLKQGPLQNKTNLYTGPAGLQSQNAVINQELIFSIGASEEFKKIVQQKNTTIKKLMKEKAQLYNKIYEQKAQRS